MSQRIAIYARYSSNLQNAASIEDQIRLCSEKAASESWKIINCYTDAGISGASLMRPGIQSLMQAALSGEFDILLTEALDRLSRDQEDIAGLFKRMEFAGVKIITLSEGEISSLHIGLKGTMNAMFLKDLADKTRRGLRGRVEKGKSGGGLAFGYSVVKRFNADGEAIKGDREINQEQAKIIRRIFHEYAHHNKSPKAIAATLNKENIPCPSGKSWGQSTINGNRKRGTGILNNELYIGQLIWNRQRFIKNPTTGKRVTRLNDEAEWIRQEIPELRIIPQGLWETAKARQKALDKKPNGLWRRNRPQYLLSGLLKCGVCGGGYSKINSERYGCSNARNKGDSVCANKKTIKRETLERSVLSALQTHLMRDDLVQVFCEEYTRHLNTLRSQQDQTLKAYRVEQAKLAKERENIIQAIKDGVPGALVKDDLTSLSARSQELEEILSSAPNAASHGERSEGW
ncbi:MAG: recombinase family protein [gamma proteobacterium endosymbiont of Lamellibrachia anaximandri]|nr:recombinase family protein [gamma proteobacterium endosymbiont of Lamellibrachia anaximandri]